MTETPTVDQLADNICQYVRQQTTDQNIAVQALNEATTICRTGKPWTEKTGTAGGGTTGA